MAEPEKLSEEDREWLLEMSKEPFTEEDRKLFLEIEIDIKRHPNRYRKAGKWLDEFCNTKDYYLRQKDILSVLTASIAEWQSYKYYSEIYIGDNYWSIKHRIKTLKQIIKEGNEKGEMLPPVHEQFSDVGEFFLKRDRTFVSAEDAKRICLITWLISDIDADETRFSITSFDRLPWLARDGRMRYIATHLLKDKIGRLWLKLAHRAWAKLEAEDELLRLRIEAKAKANSNNSPAETKQGTTSNKKNSKLDFFCKLYEKTLKVFFSAVIEAMKS